MIFQHLSDGSDEKEENEESKRRNLALDQAVKDDFSRGSTDHGLLQDTAVVSARRQMAVKTAAVDEDV